jgi:hypothetical protein
VNVGSSKSTMVSHVVFDDARACLDRLECWMIWRCTQKAMPSGFGSWVEPTWWSGSTFFTPCVQCGLSHSRRPGQSSPGQPGTELFLTTLGRGASSFHQAIVVRGLVQDAQGACGEMREQWLGKPRGEMLPVHLPVIISCPLRSLQDPLGLWDPACRRQGLDKHQTWPLARWSVDPRPIFFKIPGKRIGMVFSTKGSSRSTSGRCRLPSGVRLALF